MLNVLSLDVDEAKFDEVLKSCAEAIAWYADGFTRLTEAAEKKVTKRQCDASPPCYSTAQTARERRVPIRTRLPSNLTYCSIATSRHGSFSRTPSPTGAGTYLTSTSA